MAGRILVIRGGAIGDFVVTLPAIHLLRSAFPYAHIEIMGYRHITALAENRFYSQASRSIEYAPLARFFSHDLSLPSDLTDYFSSFHQVISYLYDPDSIFANNLARSGVKDLLRGPGKILPHSHATAQLAAPLARLALYLEDPCPHLYPTPEDHAAARLLLPPSSLPHRLAIHPGSGSKTKNWPLPRWISLIEHLLSHHPALSVSVLGGEADLPELSSLQTHFAHLPPHRILFLSHIPLPTLAAFLQSSTAFLGHDSGIAHIAAATGCPSLILFGPSSPSTWAPPNPSAHILQAPSASMDSLSLDSVLSAAQSLLPPN